VSDITPAKVALEARDIARAATSKIEAHEDLCATRYANIEKQLARFEGIFKWAGTTLFVLIVGMLGWSLKQQISANDAMREALAARVELIERLSARESAERPAPDQQQQQPATQPSAPAPR